MTTPIPKDIKEQVLTRVREGKESVAEIARQHGVKVNTVYNWISRDVNGLGGGGSLILEAARLKKDNNCLKQIIGSLLLMQERGEKIAVVNKAFNKTDLAKRLGVSRSSLYY